MPSALFLKLRSAVRNGIQRTECKLQDSLEILIGKGKLGFRNYRFFHSSSLSGLTDLQGFFPSGTVLAACSDSLSVNCGRNISAVGAFSRTVFVPSVSGPAFQVCRYHIDCALVDSSQIPPPVSKCQSNPMAVSSSGVVIGGFIDSLKLKHGHLSSSASSADILYGNRSIHPRISLKNLEKPNNYAIYGQLLHSIGKRWCNCNLSSGSGSRAFHSSLPSCLSAGTARDVSFDNSGGEEQVTSSEEKISAGKTLKLLSGSCYLPHPDKEDTGGEDAHFICADEQAIGVADGVGGWADLGIDSGQFSRELMSKSVSAIQEEPKGSINPARVLEKAHSSIKAKGSSTACVIALGDQ
ncbi:hypothetical protein Gohar_023849, partial [Gossypium harknessii]|nr:hypothetical protein [Gossypium harknessii]